MRCDLCGGHKKKTANICNKCYDKWEKSKEGTEDLIRDISYEKGRQQGFKEGAKQKKYRRNKMNELIRGLIICIFIVCIIMIPGYFIIKEDLKELKERDEICRFYGWEAVDINSLGHFPNFRCYKNIQHTSGLGNERIFSGIIDLEKQNE